MSPKKKSASQINPKVEASAAQQTVDISHLKKVAQNFIDQNPQSLPILKFAACVFFHYEVFSNQANDNIEALLESPRGAIFDREIDEMSIDKRKKFYQDFRNQIIGHDKALNPGQYKTTNPIVKTETEKLRAKLEAKKGIVYYSEETKDRINQIVQQVLQDLSESNSQIKADEEYSFSVKTLIGRRYGVLFTEIGAASMPNKVEIEIGKKDTLPLNPPTSSKAEAAQEKSFADFFEYIILSRRLMRETEGLHDVLRVAAILYDKFVDKSRFIDEIGSQFQSIFEFEKEYEEIKRFLKDIKSSKEAVEIFMQFKERIFELHKKTSEVNKKEERDFIIIKILEDVARLNELGYSPKLLTDPELLKNPTLIVDKDIKGVKFIYEGGLEDNGEFISGILSTALGRYFVGQFKDGKPCKGRYIFPNGDIYEGALNERDLFCGEGVHYFANGSYKKGEFKDGKLLKGEGQFIFPDSNPNFSYYKGGIENDQPSEGVVSYKDGRVMKVTFKDGALILGEEIVTKPQDSVLQNQPLQSDLYNIADLDSENGSAEASQTSAAGIDSTEFFKAAPSVFAELTKSADSQDFFKVEFYPFWERFSKEKPEDFVRYIEMAKEEARIYGDKDLSRAIKNLEEFLLEKIQEKTSLNPETFQEERVRQKSPDGSPATPIANIALPSTKSTSQSK